MSKQLMKRHKRAVTRAKAKKAQSEPDVRTPEQLAAAREASRPTGGWGQGAPSSARSTSPVRGQAGAAAHSASKSDA